MMPTPARNIADSSADLSVGARKTGRLLAAEDRRGRRVKATGKVLAAPLAAGEAEPANFGLWDSVPRYAVSRQPQKWRRAGTFPALLEMPFHYRGRTLTAIIQPAAVKGKDGAIRSYYPGASEELIEGVLRKLAADQHSGYSMPHKQRSGVVFTLHVLRKELERRGHGRTYAEIVLSLDILSSAVIQVATADGQGDYFTSTRLYLYNLVRGSTRTRSPDAQWYAELHPFLGVVDLPTWASSLWA